MSIRKGSLVLMMSRRAENALGLVENSSQQGFEVELIYPPKVKGRLIREVPEASLTVLNQDINRKNLAEKLPETVFLLAEKTALLLAALKMDKRSRHDFARQNLLTELLA